MPVHEPGDKGVVSRIQGQDTLRDCQVGTVSCYNREATQYSQRTPTNPEIEYEYRGATRHKQQQYLFVKVCGNDGYVHKQERIRAGGIPDNGIST